MDDLRAVVAFAAAGAERVLAIFENDRPGDRRPRRALEAATAFAAGGPRGELQRSTAWAALRAARDAPTAASEHAARAAMSAAGAAYLHPLADAHQVRHILGAAAHAARAAELSAGDDAEVGIVHLAGGVALADADAGARDVLTRYPAAPTGGGRVGHLVRVLDADLRRRRTPADATGFG